MSANQIQAFNGPVVYIYIYIYIYNIYMFWFTEKEKNESNLKIHSKHKTCFENVYRLLYIYPQTYTSLDFICGPPTNMADCLLLFSLSIFSVVGIGV